MMFSSGATAGRLSLPTPRTDRDRYDSGRGSSPVDVRRDGGQLHRDAEPAFGPGTESEGSVVRLRDALDDGQAEADTCMVGAYAFGAPLERLRQGRDHVRGELLAGVLDREHDRLGAGAGRNPYRAPFGQVVDDRVVHEVRRHLPQQRMRTDGGGKVAGGLDGETAFFSEGEERLGGLFRGERQVDVLAREGSLVGAA